MSSKRRKVMEPMDVVTTTTSKKRKLSPSSQVPKAIQNYVKKAIVRDAEMKYFDVASSNTASAASYFAENLLRIPQGVQQNQRIGDRIRVHRVQIHASVNAGDDWNTTRFILTANQTRTTTSGTSLINGLLTGPPNPEAEPVWVDRVMYPHWVAVDGASGTSASRPQQVNIDRKVNWLVKYADTTTSDPINRNLFFQLHSDSTVIPHPGLNGWCRISFTDA